MDGQNELETSSNTTQQESPANKELKQVDDYLAKFEELIGLTASLNKNTIEKARELLVSDWSELKEMSAVDLAINAIVLTDYGLTIQRVINREKATIHWVKERLKNVSFDQYKKFCDNLNYKKREAELRLGRIENLHFSIKNLADKIEWLSRLKGNNNEQNKKPDGD